MFSFFKWWSIFVDGFLCILLIFFLKVKFKIVICLCWMFFLFSRFFVFNVVYLGIELFVWWEREIIFVSSGWSFVKN